MSDSKQFLKKSNQYLHRKTQFLQPWKADDRFQEHKPLKMSNITVTYRDGRVAQLEQVYIRGSKIRFLILPDMLKNAPMLKSMKNKNQGSGAGRGKAAILKAQVAARGRGRGMGRGNIFQKRR
ncbi:small nuclear ribonucleoprotein Sm D3 isoform X2 [Ornithorhynchus anatinus]|uniref:small nuclear ribonucleoprotein Sm D3 isoform X2 n=1 Tax=Ornithorhynchus anatinus TaxID=9258 RepID=UPI0010A87623|nr:small nuclear ribonucleoprotein Sm D3 isoform X2 [Ornithorhynchus anatinus]